MIAPWAVTLAGTEQWLGWAVVGLVAGLLIVLLYRFERRQVSARVGRALLIARLAAVALVVAMLLEPIIIWTETQVQRGLVVVAVDASESMSARDGAADRLALLKRARALEMRQVDGQPVDLDSALAAESASPAPSPSPAHVASPESRLGQDAPQTQSQWLDRLAAEVARLTRRQIIDRLLDTDVFRTLRRDFDTLFVAFSRGVSVGPADQLPALLKAAADPKAARYTDLAGPLDVALDRAGAGRVVGVVLLTDGQANLGANPVERATRLGARGVPIFAVAPGTVAPAPDVVLVALDGPDTAYRNDTALLTATIDVHGYPAAGPDRLKVSLKRMDGTRVPAQSVSPRGPARFLAEFSLPMTTAGREQLTVTVDPLPGELRTDNNAADKSITVTEDKTRVLLVDERPRWEFRYLRTALRRDPRVNLTAVLLSPPVGSAAGDLPFARTLPVEPAAYEALDAVILGDVSPDHLTPVVLDRLRRFVSDAGGTLIVVAGRDFMPAAFQSPELWQLLPIRPASVSPPPGPFTLALTPEGREAGLMRLLPEPDANERLWRQLPALWWAQAAEPKPGAAVMACRHVPNLPADLAARRHPVIVVGPYGLGQVLWCGVDATWRWRYKVADQWHHRFWGQVLRWAARLQLPAGNHLVRFGPERAVYPEGERVTVIAQFRDQGLQTPRPGLVAARIVAADPAGPDREVSVVTLDPVAEGSRTLKGFLDGLPAGSYHLKLRCPDLPPAIEQLAAPLAVQAPPSTELLHLGVRRELLEKLAAESAGKVLDLEDLPQLPRLLHHQTQEKVQTHEILLWNHWALLVVFLVVVTVEWILRKVVGLP